MVTGKVRALFVGVLVTGLALGASSPAFAGFGDFIKKAVKKEIKKHVPGSDKDKDKTESKPATEAGKTPDAAKPADAAPAVKGKHGVVLFSDKPFDPAKPPTVSKPHFKAGQPIYGFMKAEKTWREMFGRKHSKEVQVLLRIDIDGKRKINQYMTLTQPKHCDSKHFVLDIAPDVAKMTNYADKTIKWSTSRKRTIGPSTFTHYMGQMKPGKHTVRIGVFWYGGWWVAGEFTIEGESYQKYADLHKQINQVLAGGATLPAAKMVNKKMANQMLDLCRNAGWTNILALNIVDKDWWIDRVSGGNSSVKSRHMDAAVAAKAADGSCYYCICRFHQQKLITGAFGPLELTHTGQKRKIPCKNLVPNVKDGKVQ